MASSSVTRGERSRVSPTRPAPDTHHKQPQSACRVCRACCADLASRHNHSKPAGQRMRAQKVSEVGRVASCGVEVVVPGNMRKRVGRLSGVMIWPWPRSRLLRPGLKFWSPWRVTPGHWRTLCIPQAMWLRADGTVVDCQGGTYQVDQVLQCREWREDLIAHTIQAIHSERPVVGTRSQSKERRAKKNEEE